MLVGNLAEVWQSFLNYRIAFKCLCQNSTVSSVCLHFCFSFPGASLTIVTILRTQSVIAFQLILSQQSNQLNSASNRYLHFLSLKNTNMNLKTISFVFRRHIQNVHVKYVMLKLHGFQFFSTKINLPTDSVFHEFFVLPLYCTQVISCINQYLYGMQYL